MARQMVEKIVCDLCKCEALANINHEKTNARTCNQKTYYTDTDGNEWLAMQVPVRFDCSQNDGYPMEPYFSMEKLDLCPECQKRLLDEWPILGYGAQGYNSYKIKER